MSPRCKVVVPALAVMASLSLLFVAWMPFGSGLGERAFAWVAVMCGPVFGTTSGMLDYPVTWFGWYGLLFATAHPLRPHWATGFITIAGLFFWWVSGVAAVGLSFAG